MKTTPKTPALTDRQKFVLKSLQKKTRAGIALLARVWATPSGGWAETRQAENQAYDALPQGIGFEESMETVALAGLVPHYHPDRTRPVAA